MKTIGVKYEICDIDTGEMLFDIRQKTFLLSSGIQGFGNIRQRFLNFVDSGRNVSICVTCFDVRYRLDDVENIFIRNKHIDGIF